MRQNSGTRFRQGKKNDEWKDPEEEFVYLIASLPAGETAPEAASLRQRGHWGVEIMRRNKDVILGEDGYTNRSDNAPRNIFSLIGFALKILKSVSPSPTRAIEQFQDDRNKALRLFSCIDVYTKETFAKLYDLQWPPRSACPITLTCPATF